MQDIFNLPSKNNTQIFTAKSDYQIWNKPNNINFVYIFCLGSGGGGAGGNNTTSTTQKPGGNGGNSSAYTTGIFSANNLPDQLYLNVAYGGTAGTGALGATAATAGSSGALSSVYIDYSGAATSLLLQNGTTVATGGQISGQAIGTAPTAWTSSFLSSLGNITVNAGVVGSLGGTSASPTALTFSKILTGGAGGGSYSAGSVFNGGSITGPTFATLSGGISTSVSGATGGEGASGYSNINLNDLKYQFLLTGGTGGGASATGAGGKGGDGAFGCGGGGGGGGLSPNGGGNGGKGGDGLIIISCW